MMHKALFTLALAGASAFALTAHATTDGSGGLTSIGVGASIDVEEVSSKEIGGRPDSGPDKSTDDSKDGFVRRVFAAKFVCGSITASAEDLERPSRENVHQLTPGTYATAINIFNPYDFGVTIRKTVVLAFPERFVFGDHPDAASGGGTDGPSSSEPREEHVDGFWAFEVDCEDIRWLLGGGEPGDRHDKPDQRDDRFLKGFVVIETEGERDFAPDLQVTGVYTYKNVDAVVRQDDGKEPPVAR